MEVFHGSFLGGCSTVHVSNGDKFRICPVVGEYSRRNIDIIGNVPNEKIWKILDIVALDTLVGDGDQNILGGQKQCIAIARTFLSDTEIVVFIEATSNLGQLMENYR